MKIWVLSVVLLLVAVETSQGVYHWVEHLILPLPILLLAGVGLAIASNINYLQPSHQKTQASSELLSSNPKPE
jgi:hypothetical protein